MEERKINFEAIVKDKIGEASPAEKAEAASSRQLIREQLARVQKTFK